MEKLDRIKEALKILEDSSEDVIVGKGR